MLWLGRLRHLDLWLEQTDAVEELRSGEEGERFLFKHVFKFTEEEGEPE